MAMAGLLGGGKNSLGGSIMQMLSSGKGLGGGASLLPLLQLLGGGKTPPLADVMQLLSALPRPAAAESAAAEEAASAPAAGGAALTQLLSDPQVLASLMQLLGSVNGGKAEAAAGEMGEDGYEYAEDEAEDEDICAGCRAACPRALQFFPSYERVQLMSRAFPRY